MVSYFSFFGYHNFLKIFFGRIFFVKRIEFNRKNNLRGKSIVGGEVAAVERERERGRKKEGEKCVHLFFNATEKKS